MVGRFCVPEICLPGLITLNFNWEAKTKSPLEARAFLLINRDTLDQVQSGRQI